MMTVALCLRTQSLRIIRTANRLDDVYDRLHSFEKVYGVPAQSVVTSLVRSVARDTERAAIPASSPMARLAVSLSAPLAQAPRGACSVPPGHRTLASSSISARSTKSAEARAGSRRRRENRSPEGDENDAPLQRARVKLNFDAVNPRAAASPEKLACAEPTTPHR